ncbi:MAG TPA: glutamate synthase central domain-containing protein, partial [Chroococcales cyanobacterium]
MTLPPGQFANAPEFSADYLTKLHTAFGYGKEEVDVVVAGMAATADEPVFSMGDDTPLAVLSEK